MQEDSVSLPDVGWRLRVLAGEWQRGESPPPCIAEQYGPGSPARCERFFGRRAMRTLQAVRENMRTDAPVPLRNDADDGDFYSYSVYVGAHQWDSRRIPVARFDVVLRSGVASASILLVDYPRFDLEPFNYKPEDGIWEVVRLILQRC